jgi:hypothetical protein
MTCDICNLIQEKNLKKITLLLKQMTSTKREAIKIHYVTM